MGLEAEPAGTKQRVAGLRWQGEEGHRFTGGPGYLEVC